jgi:hypothetical protein
LMWWYSHLDAGRSQSGNMRPPSRAAGAVRWCVV